jgi:nicotinamidase-related amidase
MRETVIPNPGALQDTFRNNNMDVIDARIAPLLDDGRHRSQRRKMPGRNCLLMPKDHGASQIITELAPVPGEIVVTKTTDSALTGTDELHQGELEIINMIYCHVLSSDELLTIIRIGPVHSIVITASQ